MKNSIKPMWKSYLLPTLLVFICMVQVAAQTKVGNRLMFSSEQQLLSTLATLESQAESYVDTRPEAPDGTFQDDYPTLKQFADGLGFQSLRQADDQTEFSELSAGVPVDRLSDGSWIMDAYIESVLNPNRVVQVGTRIAYLYSKETTLIVNDGNEQTLNYLLSGENPGKYPNVEVETRSGASCSADFTGVLSFFISNTGQFTYTGTPTSGVSFQWNFGDNTTSTDQNPSKTFAAQGIYNVCLTIKTEDCVSTECKLVPVNQGCVAWFDPNPIPGSTGGYQFTDKSKSVTSIVSWLWNFGDGGTSTLQNPSHTYGCDGKYKVTLTITSANGCKRTISRNAEVSSYRCCDKDIEEKETKATIDIVPDRRVKLNANDVQIGWPFNAFRVNAEITHYKKGWLDRYWKKKAQMQVTLNGNVYSKNQLNCMCSKPHDIYKNCSDNTKHLSCTKIVGERFRTAEDDPWSARFFVDNNLIHTVAYPNYPITCDDY